MVEYVFVEDLVSDLFSKRSAEPVDQYLVFVFDGGFTIGRVRPDW